MAVMKTRSQSRSNVISSTTTRDELTKNTIRVHIKRAQCVHNSFLSEVMSINAYEEDKKKKAYELTFTNKDMQRVDTPHNNALILTVNINTFDVKRVLINPGSSSKIIYRSLFDRLKLLVSQAWNADYPAFSFSREVVWPIAIAEVSVHMSPTQKNMEFIVMNIDLPYNAILSRGWLGKMKVVAYSYHQKLKFPSKEGIVVVRGKQEDACHCFGLAAPKCHC